MAYFKKVGVCDTSLKVHFFYFTKKMTIVLKKWSSKGDGWSLKRSSTKNNRPLVIWDLCFRPPAVPLEHNLNWQDSTDPFLLICICMMFAVYIICTSFLCMFACLCLVCWRQIRMRRTTCELDDHKNNVFVFSRLLHLSIKIIRLQKHNFLLPSVKMTSLRQKNKTYKT